MSKIMLRVLRIRFPRHSPGSARPDRVAGGASRVMIHRAGGAVTIQTFALEKLLTLPL
ncbi:MAG: hypothetical protein R3D55_04370 [Chloroflexota bacterium]